MSNKDVDDVVRGDLNFPVLPTNRLRYMRMCRNLTQQQLADRVGVTQPTISEIERRFTQRVKPELSRRISKALRIGRRWLFDENGRLRP